MSTLLVIRLDGPLCQRVYGGSGLEAWRKAIAETDPPRDEYAAEALSVLPQCRIVLVTGRTEALREATTRWLAKHFPTLEGVPLLMRAEGDDRSGVEVLRDQVARVRQEHRVVLVDDGEENEYDERVDTALRDGDAVLVAPEGWPQLAEALGG